ncbi:MAG: S1C family serine protease [Candidatus Bathyarchaeia archaeon]|jgi:S1-C subfamily serine protease
MNFRFYPTFTKFAVLAIVGFFALGILIGGLTGYFLQINQVNVASNTSTFVADSNTLAEVYNNSIESVVLIRSITNQGTAQGSGFVYDYSGRNVVITNNHVIAEANEVSVTFSNGQGYAASVIGFDPYVDLAVLSVEAPDDQFNPLSLGNSSSLFIGQSVLAMGSPYGLEGSLSTGIVSGLGRTLTEDTSGSHYSIANIIQLTAPINPGNSGGPLLNFDGEVVGITTAIIAQSQSIGFAVPSNTISREIGALVENGTYTNHSYLGISGTDMNYFLAQEIGADITYGELVQTVASGGPAAGKLMVDDIIVGINQTRILSTDALAGYLAAETVPGDTVVIEVQRDNQSQNIEVVLGSRPPTNG